MSDQREATRHRVVTILIIALIRFGGVEAEVRPMQIITWHRRSSQERTLVNRRTGAYDVRTMRREENRDHNK